MWFSTCSAVSSLSLHHLILLKSPVRVHEALNDSVNTPYPQKLCSQNVTGKRLWLNTTYMLRATPVYHHHSDTKQNTMCNQLTQLLGSGKVGSWNLCCVQHGGTVSCILVRVCHARISSMQCQGDEIVTEQFKSIFSLQMPFPTDPHSWMAAQ